jgi:ABC-2 type transport system ATP-binding protein
MDLAVDVENVVKIYEGKTKALDGVNLQVESGKVFALLGPNGSGKTTLIRILTTQFKSNSGRALVMGHDVTTESGKVRRLVGYVPQEMSVWTDITGYENLLIYAKIYGVPSETRKKLILEAIDSIGLSDVGNTLVKSYSGGMIRRLEIACALLVRPKILFLDEPTIGLDPVARKVVWEKLTSFKKEFGTTVFFNTHYMDEADLYSDQIGIISRGKIIKTGTTEELKRSVGGDVITFEIEGGTADDHVFDIIRRLELVREVTIHNSELIVVTDNSETAMPLVVRLLEGEGVTVEKVSMNKPNLDDVFLKYAGTRLESGGSIKDVRQTRGRIRRG